MDAETRRVVLLTAGAVAGYAVVMTVNPARPSLRDGLRCLLRYKQIWAVPVVFSLCYSAFTVWMRFYECRSLPDNPPMVAPWTGWQPTVWNHVFALCWLPSLEGTAAVFNYVVRPFPLSVLGALCFLVNWRAIRQWSTGGCAGDSASVGWLSMPRWLSARLPPRSSRRCSSA